MSAEFTIQNSPAPTTGAQKPLAADTDSRRGDEFPQNQLSYCRGENVEASSSAVGGARNDLNEGAHVSGRQAEQARPVDSRTLTGSYPGDHRQPSKDVAKSALHQAAEGQRGPRSSAGQFPNGRADTNGKGGCFGNEHANRSWPDPADSNN